ncbi:MAG: translocation/assembly module TamB domain-containing protein [Armatimonadetes bacterium]|nr:translocation/assembly module TamB domain-containing protein [Armatimonadota bacterium]
MTRRTLPRYITWIVVWAPAGGICLLCAIYLWQAMPHLERQAIEASIAWLQNEWRVPISVARVRADLRRSQVSLHHLLLRDPTAPQRTLMVAQEVKLLYLFSGEPVIEVTRPSIQLVRLADGSWNFSPLLPKRPPPPAERFWTVRLTDATLHLEDYKVRPTLQTTLRGIRGLVRSAAGVTTFGLEAPHTYRTQVHGWLHDGSLRLRVDATEVPVKLLLRYLPASSVDPGDARASGTIWVFNTPQKRWHYYGKVQVHATEARWRLHRSTILLNNVKGSGEIETGWARWQVKANVGTGRVQASGSVQWQPRLNLQVSAQLRQIPPATLRPWQRRYISWLTPRAPVDATLLLLGTPQQPYLRGEVRTAQASVQKMDVQDFTSKIILNSRQIFLPAVAFRTAGGNVRAQGIWWRENKRWQFVMQCNADRVDLSRLRPYAPSQMRGVLRARALAFGSPQHPQVVANVWGERMAGERWRCDRALARVRWTPSSLTIDGAMLEDWTGVAYVSGKIDLTQQRLALRVRADEIALAPWVERLLPQRQRESEVPTAWVYARGEIEGTLRQPLFRGVVEAVDIRWRRWTLDYLVARVEASTRGVRALGGIARRPPMEITWQGELTHPLDTEEAHLSAHGAANHLDVQELLAALQEPSEQEGASPVEAVGRAFFHIEGHLRSPRFQLSLSAPTAQIRDWNLTDLRGTVEYHDGSLKVSDLSARLGEGAVQVQGERDQQGRLLLRIEGERLPLAQIQPLLPKELPREIRGEVSASGFLSGTQQEPELHAQLQLREVHWDTLQFSEGSAQLEWRNGRWSAQDVRLTHEDSEVHLRTIRFSPQPQNIEAEGVMSLSALERWVQRLMDSVWLEEKVPRLGRVLREVGRITGSATVPFRLQGEGGHWAMQATVQLSNLELDGNALGMLQAQIRRDTQGTWQIPEMVLQNGEHRLTASGMYQRDGVMRLSVEAYNFDLSWLQRWLPSTTELRGKLEAATLDAEGSVDSPTVTLTLALRQPQWGALRVERMITSKVRLSNGEVQLGEVILAQPGGQLRIWGTLPFRWESLSIPEEVPLDVHFEAAPQPLRALLAYLPAAEVTEVGGQWTLRASLSGTRRAPQLAGELRIEADRLRAAALATGLRDVRAVVQLAHDTVRLAEFSAVGDTPRGGRLVGSGTLQFGGGQPERLDATLRLERFWLAEQNLSGQYGEEVRAFLNAALKITGSVENPQVAGTITATGGAFVLPSSFPEQRAAPRRLAVNPQFQQVVLRIGENMWLNSPRLSAQAVGDIVLSGTLQEPVIHGQLGLERGYVYFPTARFRLQPGGFIALDYPVPGDTPFRVSVNVQASTNLSLLSPVGGVRRYEVTVLANGTITSPEGLRTEFRSNPPDLSAQQIARALGIGTIEELLTGRNVEQVLQREVINLFTSAYVPQLFSPLERGLEEALQLREFRLEYGRYDPLAVTLVKRLGSGFSLSYWRTVSAAPRDRYILKVLYELPEWARLARRLQISLSIDEQEQYRWGIEGSFRF